nr:hypothetical protein [Tanacetum cinerariifolium]
NDGQIVTEPTQRKAPGNVSRADEQGTSSSQPQEVHNSGYDLEENVVSYDAYLAEVDLINETPIIPPVEE